MKTLDPVFREIYELHSRDSVTYVLDEAAQQLFSQIREGVNKGLSDGSSAVVVDESSSDESDEDGEDEVIQPIRSLLGKKYTDQLERLSLSLHVFKHVAGQMLSKSVRTVTVPETITKDTLLQSRKLLDHIIRQNFIVYEVSNFYRV